MKIILKSSKRHHFTSNMQCFVRLYTQTYRRRSSSVFNKHLLTLLFIIEAIKTLTQQSLLKTFNFNKHQFIFFLSRWPSLKLSKRQLPASSSYIIDIFILQCFIFISAFPSRQPLAVSQLLQRSLFR